MFKDIKRRNRKRLKKDGSDSNFYRCRVCDFICDSDQVEVNRANQSRSEYEDGNKINWVGTSVDSVESTRGCPLCGTLFSKIRE